MKNADDAYTNAARKVFPLTSGNTALATEAGQDKPTAGWKIEHPQDWDCAEILRNKPELALIVDPNKITFLEMGDIIAILGKSKTQKSFLAQQIAFSVSSGLPLWGEYEIPQPKDVLIVQFEVKAGHYNKRVIRMANGMGIALQDIGQRLSIVNARGTNTDLEVVKEALLHYGRGKALIIIDPLYALLKDDENKTTSLAPVFQMFREVSEETGAAIAFVHHDGKGQAGDRELVDRGSGSGILGRFYDTGIMLTPHVDSTQQTKKLVIECVCRNRAEPEAFTLEFDPTGLMFVQSDLPPDKRTSRTNRGNAKATNKIELSTLVPQAMKYIADYYAGNPNGRYLSPTKFSQWAESPKGLNLNRVRAREMAELIKDEPGISIQKQARGEAILYDPQTTLAIDYDGLISET